MRVPCLGLIALLLLSGAGVGFADDELLPLDEALASAHKQTVRDLSDLATWAKRKKALGFRHRVFERLLVFGPDNRRALKALKYKRSSSKEPWVQAPNYRRPLDRNESVLGEAEAKLKGALLAHKDRVLTAIEHFPNSPHERVKALIAELLEMCPEDKQLLSYFGDIEYEGRWVHPSTKAGALRRKALAETVRKARANATEAVQPGEEALAKEWGSAWQSDRYLVVGTVSDETVKSCCVITEVAESFCDHLFGPTDRLRGPAVTIVLSGRPEALERAAQEEWHPAIADIKVVSGVTLPTGERLAYSPDPDESRMSCPRFVFTIGLRLVFEHGLNRGWITEGMGQRLCWYVAGQHGPAFVNYEQTDRALSSRRGVPPSDAHAWPAAAAEVLQKRGFEVLLGVLTRRLNAMSRDDVLVAYGLAAFLIETRPKEFVAFTKANAKRHDVDAYLKETLGIANIKVLSAQLTRWLSEYREP